MITFAISKRDGFVHIVATGDTYPEKEALKSMGFRREGTARDWFGNEDAILYGLLRREQRIVR